MQASILIANLHSPLLGEVLAALRRQTVQPLEVLVVGQDRYGFAISDGWVQMITTAEPKPPAVALNIAFCYARGEIFCFLDGDCIPKPDWLERIIEVHQEGHAVIGGSTDLFPNHYWQLCDNIACQGDFLVSAPAGERVHLQSGNMSIRRDVIRAVGFFDEQFRRAAGEDTEYSLRLRTHGYQLYFDPRPLVEHHTNRITARMVWRHLHLFGRSWPAVAYRYQQLLGGTFWLSMFRRLPLLAFSFLIPLAVRDVLLFYQGQPALLQQYWYTIPGVLWARIAWYVGVLAADV